jgi:alpha-beta hydrolase superfamily lysophospholipase
MKAYQGLRHDIYKEDKEYRDNVIEDLIEWLEKYNLTAY